MRRLRNVRSRIAAAAALLVACAVLVRDVVISPSASALDCKFNEDESILLELQSVRVNGVETSDTGNLDQYMEICACNTDTVFSAATDHFPEESFE